MLRQILLVGVAVVCAAFAQKYDGPRPPKPDVPFLKHADNLVATEVAQAKEEKRKDDTVYTIEGASSSAKTPLAEPIFLFQSEKLHPDKLQLFKLDNKNVTNYLYTDREASALVKGGVQRLFVGNLKAGQHELVAVFTGEGPHTRDYRRGASLKFEKGIGPKYIELTISDRESKMQPEFVVKEWE